MNQILEIKVNLKGIYTMGDYPWIGGAMAANIWDRYFANEKFDDGTPWIFWKSSLDKNGTRHLVTTFGGAMIHPMDGIHIFMARNAYGHEQGALEQFKFEIEELTRIFEEVAKKCKGTAKVLTRVHDVDCHFFCNID